MKSKDKDSASTPMIVGLVIIVLLGVSVYFFTKKELKSPKINEVTGSKKVISTLPKLLNFGMNTRVECQFMKPVMKEITEGYKEQIDATYYDILDNPEAGKTYGVTQVPQQIFYDVKGKELYRNTGFISTEDIFKKFAELGFKLTVNGEFKKMATPNGVTEKVLKTSSKVAEISAEEEKPFDFVTEAIPKNYTGIVFYMYHSRRQCPCNEGIEYLSQSALESNFKSALFGKKILWQKQSVKTRTGGSIEAVDTYDLYPVYHLHNGVVLQAMINGEEGEFLKLDKVDGLRGDRTDFIAYITKELTAFMKDFQKVKVNKIKKGLVK